jgi:hypothetical protein
LAFSLVSGFGIDTLWSLRVIEELCRLFRRIHSSHHRFKFSLSFSRACKRRCALLVLGSLVVQSSCFKLGRQCLLFIGRQGLEFPCHAT